MSDQQTSQLQQAQGSPTSATGNGSQTPLPVPRLAFREGKQSSAPKSGKVAPIAQPSRKSTGPRTTRGKEKSKFNALKHGLLSKALLLKDESRVEYNVLLNGLLEDLQPQGKLETVLVENLAVLLWRKRRLLQVETAEISKKDLLQIDSIMTLRAQSLDYARPKIDSHGALKNCDNRSVVREAINSLTNMRLALMNDDPDEVKKSGLPRLLFGSEQDGAANDRFGRLCQEVARLTGESAIGKDTNDANQLIEEMRTAIDAEIKRLTELHNDIVRIELRKSANNVAVAGIPLQESADRLLRYEAHLSREFDRTLNQLERLQRMRKGQPLPPQVDVKIS
jgi:hypothetical protein